MTVGRSSAASAMARTTLGEFYPVDRPAHGADDLLIGIRLSPATTGTVGSSSANALMEHLRVTVVPCPPEFAKRHPANWHYEPAE